VIRWLLKGIAAVIGLCFVSVAALLVAMWFDHKAATTLPTPTGPFAVGRVMDYWTDDSQTATPGTSPEIKRVLAVWIWYPTDASGMEPNDYLPPSWRTALERDHGPLFSEFLARDLSRVHPHSVRDSAVSPRQRAYPVVIMKPGLSALTVEYTTLAEDLSSHGYVVVGFDAPNRTSVVVLPDGRVVTRTRENDPEIGSEQVQMRIARRLLAAWCADTSFVLDRLEQLNTSDPSGKFIGRLDMQRVGIFGHSLGGATAAQFCHNDSRCKAGIDVDGAPLGSVVREGLHQPFMFLFGDRGDATSSSDEDRQIGADVDSIYERLPPEGRLRLTIRGADHYNFSDGAVWRSPIVLKVFSLIGISGMDGRRQLAITAHCVHSFFDVFLKGDPKSELQFPSPLYPEVRL
jgi:dienelactone hydrolase